MPDGTPFDCEREIASAPFTAVLFSADVFRRLGLLDESFESYLEDVEFGLRCAARDITGRYVPQARAIHTGSASLGRWHPEIVRRIARNQLLLASRYFPAHYWWPVLVGQLLWGAVALRHGTSRAWLRGKREGLRSFRFAPDHTERLDAFLRNNEQLIRKMSSDRYWKLYFLLTAGAK
jgi:hypothetical protein